MKPGPYVMLAVTDNGSGIDDHAKAHLFEPFFTTKHVGKGTGLGLAMIYGIVTQSFGRIAVESEVGKGTEFRIYLPRAREALTAASPVAVAPAPSQRAEVVLLVEDELKLRKIVLTALRSSGYRVLEAADGAEALQVATAFAGQIDLLLTDVVMPRVSGRQLAEALAHVRPGTKTLFMSGHTDDAVLRNGITYSDVAFLQKPFDRKSLLTKVRDVLAADRADSSASG
jgi:CheY-like chemotaxis protein